MASSRHKHAVPKRAGLSRPSRPRSASSTHVARRKATPVVSPWRKNAVKVALPALGVLALVGTSAAVVAQEGTVEPAAASAAAAPQQDDIIAQALKAKDEESDVTRSAERPELAAEVSPDVVATLVALEDDTEIHADAARDSPVLASLDQGDTVDVTGETDRGWTEVVHKGLPRWVPTAAVADELPPPPEPKLSNEPCPHLGEDGLQPDTAKVLRAVCAKFPEITSYGGIAGRGEHATGQALDIMVRGARGDEIAAYLQENRAELGIEYLIWQQRIWRPATSGAWRGMSNRGGDTANHMDHVHVTTYGSSATG